MCCVSHIKSYIIKLIVTKHFVPPTQFSSLKALANCVRSPDRPMISTVVRPHRISVPLEISLTRNHSCRLLDTRASSYSTRISNDC